MVRRPTAVAVRDFCGSQRFYSFCYADARDAGSRPRTLDEDFGRARWKPLAACKTLASKQKQKQA